MKNLENLILTYKDFPKKGIDFKDVLGIIQEPEVFKKLILKMSNSKIIKKTAFLRHLSARFLCCIVNNTAYKYKSHKRSTCNDK